MKFEIFTDGSCSFNNVNDTEREAHGGYGMVVVFNDSKYYEEEGYYTNTTNNRMELLAVLRAMSYMYDEFPNTPYTIYSDSAYIVNTFEKKWWEAWMKRGWKKAKGEPIQNIDLWKPIIHHYFKNQKMITIAKVPAHSGVAFNERADKLANNWRGMSNEDFSIDSRSPRSDIGRNKSNI